MLSEAQLHSLHQHGYLVVEDIIDHAHLTAVEAEYAQLMNRLYTDWYAKGWVSVAPENLDFWQKLDQCYAAGFDWYQPFDISLPHNNINNETPMHHGPAIFNIIRNPRLLDMVEQIIGAEITSNPIQHVRIKPPERLLPKDENRAHITATDWHQDRGMTHAEADQTDMVTVWLAITDATVENGCLQAAPRAKEMLPHCTKKQVGIANQFVPKDQAIPLPVRKGGAVFFHPLTPHASLSNTTNGYRWSFDLRYNVMGQPTGRSHFPEFIARSRQNPTKELRDW